MDKLNLCPHDESIPSACHINHFVCVVVSDDDRIKAIGSGNVAADNELLSLIQAVLDPGLKTSPRFVHAVFVLSYDALELVLLDRGEHFCHSNYTGYKIGYR